MTGLTDAQITAHLREQGVPDWAIESWRDKTRPSVMRSDERAAFDRLLREAMDAAHPPTGPLTLVLPWSCLVSDNRHRGPVSSRADSAAYKLARSRAHAEAREQWGPRAPFQGRIALLIVFTPPRLGRPDPTNLLKALLDALGATRDEPGVCYHDDGQIDILHVERAAPNVDRPRAEITVEEIAP